MNHEGLLFHAVGFGLLCWDRLTCAFRGHRWRLAIGDDYLCLVCPFCAKLSPGFTVTPAGPPVQLNGRDPYPWRRRPSKVLRFERRRAS